MRLIYAYCFVLGIILLFVTFNIHNSKAPLNYRSEIYADKAGYYVYLPALFLYDFNPENFPEKVDSISGQGFLFVQSNPHKPQRVVFTKYPCGVAILDAPFFAFAHQYCKLNNIPADGFSVPYHRARSVAAWFYVMSGLFLVLITLKRTTNVKPSVLLGGTTLFLFGTNLFYYTVKDAGLSHNYSFFLLALLIFFKTRVFNPQKTAHYVWLGLIAGLMVLVRPINAVFLGLFLFWGATSFSEAKTLFIAHIQKWLLWVGVMLLLFVPQLLYYQYAFGQYVNYSYGNEAFLFWKNPKIVNVFLAFQNGWITNNPLHVFTLAGIVFMIRKNLVNGWRTMAIVCGVGLLYAAWWSWELGCGLGHRGFVEFYAVLLLPFLLVLQQILSMKTVRKALLLLLLGLFVVINLKIISAYDNCWYGNGPWDAMEWLELLTKPVYVK
jgi:hypothetical protein